MRRIVLVLAFLSATLPTCATSTAGVILTPQEAMNVAALNESVSMTLRMLNETYGLVLTAPLSFSGTYSNSGGSLTVTGTASGSALNLTLSSSLSGDFGSDIGVAVSGTGSWLAAPISTIGQATWIFDSGINDYQNMNYDDQGSFGTGSRSWVVRGAELVIGAGVGGYFGGWWGAVTGALTAWTISDIVYEIVDDIVPPPPPVRPPVPPVPPTNPPPTPPTTQINININTPGNNININNGNIVIGNGATGNNVMTGTYMVQPEPSSLVLMASTGVIGIGWVGFRRRHRTDSNSVAIG